jgi:hypothetical protein
MLWHLCNPDGVSQRTTHAPDINAARDNFRLVRPGWFVASDISYRIGWTKSEAPVLCNKCFRNSPASGSRKCETCRTRDKASTRKANSKRLETNRLTPQETRREIATKNARRAIQGNILRGIIARRTRRAANET